MKQADSSFYNSQLSKNAIIYFNTNLTKKGKHLLVMLYKYQQPLKHKSLAEMLDMKSNGLTNLISRVNQVQKGFIVSESVGRCKFYTLSQIAEAYTEIVLLPEEEARKNVCVSSLHNDSLVRDVLDFLKIFQECEGDNWYIILDDLLFVDNVRSQLLIRATIKEENNEFSINFNKETYQNYINFKNALITLIVQHGKSHVQKIYAVLEHKILSERLDTLLSDILSDFYKMEPLFQLEQNDLQATYAIIDRIFLDFFPETFGRNSAFAPNPLPTAYYSVCSVIVNMAKEFKNNNYDKNIAIEQWKKKFYTENHFSCISYIAEKCNTLYIGQS